MPVQILISPPAGGKTQSVIQQVLAVVRQQPLAPVWVVLPDQLQAGVFKRRLAGNGGALGVRVNTFGGLYQEFLERAGRAVPVAPDPVAYRLIQAAIADLNSLGRLEYYQPLQSMPGFILSIRNLFGELKRALVDPARLVEEARGRESAFRELAEIYELYQTRLQTLNWADPEGLSWLAVEALEDDPTLGSDMQLLAVDGFDSFTTTQIRALELLAERVNTITITLPGSREMRRPVHQRFAQELEKLAAALQPERISAGEKVYLPGALTGLERALFETDPSHLDEADPVGLVEARSPYEETREALRWLKARLIRDGLKPAECALVVPQIETYRPYLHMVAGEFGLPLRFSQDETLVQAPPVSALLDLLALPLEKYPRRPLLDSLRSPYLELSPFGLDLDSADALDVASLVGQVVEGLDQWYETLERLAQATQPDDPEETEPGSPALPCGAEAERLRRGLQALAARLAPPSDRLHLPVWIGWLEDLLDDLGFLQDPELARDRAARRSLMGTLQALSLSAVVAGSPSLDYGAFMAELRGALESACLGMAPEQIAAAQPAILVLQMLEARGVRFQAVAILGLAEGVYPQVERADPFFSEADRRYFGLEPRLNRQQSGVFYQALTRSDRFLLLTRPYLSGDGELWEASPYWQEVRRLLPQAACERIRPDDLRPLEEAASSQELLFWAVKDAARSEQDLPASYGGLQARWQQLRQARVVLQARLARAAGSPYEGMPGELNEALAERFGSQHEWSASRLETYGSCPFRFYVEFALGLQAKQPPQLGLDASQLGSLLHAILEQAYRQADDPSDPASVVANLPVIAVEIFGQAPRLYGFRPSVLWGVQQKAWLVALEKTILENAAYDPAWTPVAYEARFGFDGQPPLLLQSESGPVRLRGVVDRIDRNAQGELRVVDYKTGGSHLSSSDLIDGLRLQLPLYALATEKALSLGKVVEGLYWKILKAEPGSLKLASFALDDACSGIDGACDLAEAHVARIVNAIRAAEFPPIPPKGGCPAYCAAAAWCWRYSPGAY